VVYDGIFISFGIEILNIKKNCLGAGSNKILAFDFLFWC